MSEATANDTSETVPPDSDHAAPLARVREGFDLPVDQNYTLVVEPWEVLGCGAVPGTAFPFGNGFPGERIREALPELEALGALAEGKLLLFGHSDAGTDAQASSERRARAVQALLVQDVAAFQAVDDEESWELNVVQACLLSVGYRPGPIDNADGPQTQAAVEAFQEDHTLQVDGIAGPLTRKALYAQYLPSLYSGALTPELSAEAFLDPATLGCGDTHPVIETQESCEDNRRVTAFAFKASRPPLVPGCHDAGGEWYRKLAEACACGARGPAPTATTLRANGPKTTFRELPADFGPPFEEFVSLKIVHPGGGAAPAQVLGAGQVSLRAETAPPTEGTFTWTCETEGVALESQAGTATLELGEDPPAEVSIRCAFVSQAGNAFEAEHALTTGFAFRYQHPEGEVSETPPRGTGEDEDSQSYLEYSGDPLDTIFDLHQDQGDGDCGPTCAAFFRFGGARASGVPTENGQQVTGGLVQDLAERMRAETSASAHHQDGTSREEMCQILREFAGSYGRRRKTFEIVDQTYDLSTEPSILLAAGSWSSWLQRLLGTSPRGVLTGIQSYSKNRPYRQALREANAAGGSVSYTNHWVVVIGATSSEVVFYDPGFGQHGRHTFPLLDLFAAHIEWAKGPIVQRSSMTSRLVVAKDPDPEWRLLAGSGICEVDAGAMTWGDRLVAQRDAEWFCNPDQADARARELSGGGKSALVVEVPHGNFGVVEVNDVGGDNARQPTPDRADSDSGDVLRRLPGVLGSIRFFLRAGGNVHLTQVRYKGTHRKS